MPAGALRISSGNPISVLKFAREATVLLRGARTANSRSLVDVLPVEPVTPMTWAPSSRRQAVARFCRAFRGSSAARTTPSCAWFASRLRVIGRDEHAPGSGLEGLGREGAAVDVRAGQADEQGSGAGRP